MTRRRPQPRQVGLTEAQRALPEVRLTFTAGMIVYGRVLSETEAAITFAPRGHGPAETIGRATIKSIVPVGELAASVPR